mgnify:CR=1 FL=1|jgi:molybdopterin synthase sulfur carrier subunit
MIVRLLYFVGVRDALGLSSELVDLPPCVTTLASLRDHLAARGEPWSALGADRRLRFAINNAMEGRADAPVSDGDEVAIFPPVTGG